MFNSKKHVIVTSITLLRIILLILYIYVYCQIFNIIILNFILLISAISDYIDGKLARYLHVTTNIGRHLDHITDKIFIITVLAITLPYNLYNILLLTIIVIRNITIILLRGFHLTYNISKIAKLKTFFEYLTLLVVLNRNILFNTYIVFLTVTTILAVISLINYIRDIRST